MSENKLSHNDNPVHENSLTDVKFIKNIAEVIKNCEPPKGIAINGYWGTGKTSSLLQLHYELTGILPTDNKKPTKGLKITTVWFEAWRYQHEPIPIIALLHEIRSRISLWNRFLAEGQKLMGVVLQGVLAAFDETIKTASAGLLNKPIAGLNSAGVQWEKNRYENNFQGQHISELLEEAITKALGRKDRKLVIFIDDLDRCTPTAALNLLEGIKVYLNLKNCVIVFGMDQRQIERALSKALDLKDDNDKYSDHYAREYLEKICQDIYHLPLPNKDSKRKYLDSLLQFLDLGSNAIAHRTELEKVLGKYDCLPANPRKIKALGNRLAVMFRQLEFGNDNSVIDNTTIQREYALLMVMTIIYTFHRQLNEQLEKNPAYINTVIIYAQNYQAVDSDLLEPMKGIKPSFSVDKMLPTNPSDSNIFRLHQLFRDLDTITENEIKKFLSK